MIIIDYKALLKEHTKNGTLDNQAFRQAVRDAGGSNKNATDAMNGEMPVNAASNPKNKDLYAQQEALKDLDPGGILGTDKLKNLLDIDPTR